MGVYLSSPVTEKVSSDKTCPNLTFGVSSMQGWRMSQEDAHNCISDFDPGTNTSFFAVYDGHGGAEVAHYTAAHLPDFIKNLPEYKEGKLTEALQEGFLGFDRILTEESVVQELKALAGVDDDENEEVEDDEGMGRTERDMLVQEADMPIEELMAKYSAAEPPPGPAARLKKLQKDKHQSPMLKAKKIVTTAANSTDRDNGASSSTADPLATRLETKLENGQTPDNDNNLNVEKELREAETQGVSSDNTANATEPDSTGDVKTEVKENSDSAVKQIELINRENGHGDTGEDKSLDQNNVGAKSEEVEPDSTSDKGCEDATKPKEPSKADEVTSGSSGSGDAPSGSGLGSSGAGDGPAGSGSGDGPSGSGSSDGPSGLGNSEVGGSASEVGSSSSGSGPSGSGCSSSAGPSGSGVQAGGSGVSSSKKVALEDDSDDDTSDDDDEYMEDSEEDDDDDDDDEDDDDLQAGGIFGVSRVSAGGDEEHTEEPGTDSGCTAVVVLLRDDKIYVANAGDSRCVLCQAGRAVDLSFDHKPEDDIERTRIEAAGGRVTNDGRVNGGLNLSRALGDHWYKRNETKDPKEQMISALPDIECATITPQDDFLVIACDGIWNYMTSQETVDFIQERMKDPKKREKPSLICEELFDFCLAPNTMGDGTGCDNMTCIIVVLDKSASHSKRDSDELDISTSDEIQPEKRPRVEGDPEQTDT